MNEAGKYLIVYATGALGVWKGAALGIAISLHPFFTGLLTALGSITASLVIYFAGDSLKQWILRRYGSIKVERQKNKFIKLANQYGVWVLGIVSPGLLGPYIPLLIGLVIFKDTRKFIIYMLIGIVLWSFALAYLFTPIFDLISSFKN